ncbi:MAG TPA: SBBP repeat-containing protein [Pyrinomonadaceae bacterium]|jgi:uncharacterized repeat protein (TIGR01451 family)
MSQPLARVGDAAAQGPPRTRPEGAKGFDGGATRPGLLEAYGKLPLRFEANRGQSGGGAKFLARGAGYTLSLTRSGAVLRLRNGAGQPGDRDGACGAQGLAASEGTLRFGLEGSNRAPRIVPLDELEGRSNYFVGAGPLTWLTDIPNYARVKYQSVYRGVDLVFYGHEGRLEYDFVVAPGASPARIRLRFDGACGVRVDDAGDLILTTAAGEVRQQRPAAYQLVGGVRREVASRYAKGAGGAVRIEVGRYDRTRPLVIDPVIIYSTIVGEGTQNGAAIAVDAVGSAYVVGTTLSVTSRKSDVFVFRLTRDGGGFMYAAYLGGAADDTGSGVAVDASGNAYVTGVTGSEDFPHTAGAFQAAKDGARDAFVTKIGPAGTLDYATFLDGGGADDAAGIGVDSSGAAYVAGTSGGGDAFVAKLNPAASGLEYLRFFGGSNVESAKGVAVGDDGSAYVTGTTLSDDFPVVNAFQGTRKGSRDVFVTKVNPAGTAFVYSTYLGGRGDDSAGGVAVGKGGEAYVTGTTNLDDFPLVNPLEGMPRKETSAFVTKFAADGRSLVYSTGLGGSASDEGGGVAVGDDGSAYVTGSSNSDDFPTFDADYFWSGTSTNAFVAGLNPAGSALLFSTRFGGASSQRGNGIAVDPSGGIYVAGYTSSFGFPRANSTNKSWSGAFVTKFGRGVELRVSMNGSPRNVLLGNDLSYTVVVKNHGDIPATGVTLTDKLPQGSTLVSAMADHGPCSPGAIVTCALGTLNRGEAATVTITVKPSAVSDTNTATATSNETGYSTGNNSASQGGGVISADVSVSQSIVAGTGAPGSKVVYLLAARNLSFNESGPVTLLDELPPGLTFLSCTSADGVCGGVGNRRSVTFQSVPRGTGSPFFFQDKPAQAIIVASVNESVAAGTVVNNTVTISGAARPDPNPSNNAASTSFTVGPAPVIAPKSNGKIIFTDPTFGRYYTARLNVVNADGTSLTKFADGAWGMYDAEWSPDGTKVAFTRSFSSGPISPSSHSVGISSTNRFELLVPDSVVFAHATWSPSGEWVAYLAFDGSVYIGRLGGTSAMILRRTDLGTSIVGTITGIDWSPDGEHFAFTDGNLIVGDDGYVAIGGNGRLFVVDVGGSHLRQLTTQPASDRQSDFAPRWSPDGTKILFTRLVSGVPNAFVINPDGTGLRRLFDFTGAKDASWSPDGTKVVFESGGNIMIANADGSGQPSQVTRGIQPSWQPLPNTDPTPTPTPTPTPAPRFKISGHVTPPTPNMQYFLKLSGTHTATVNADGAGNYTFANLPPGGTYTVTPVSDSARFTPGSRTVAELQGDVTGLDFSAAVVAYSVGGRVMDSEGRGLAGVGVALLGPGGRRDATTDGDGKYSFRDVMPGGPYSVVPSSPSLSFDPLRADLPRVLDDSTANFVGAPAGGVRAITGRVRDAAGRALAGIRVALGGARAAVARTAADGTFAFRNLPAGLAYTVMLSDAEGFTFSVPERSFPNLDADGFAEFSATTAQPVAQFAATIVSVSESAGSAELTVVRAGDTSAAASLDYETVELTASQRSDYTAAFGTLRFEKGEAKKTFKVLVGDDGLPDAGRLFRVTLTRGFGVSVGAADTAVVAINDDEASASAENPLDSSRFFVAQHYRDFLNREPDAAGLDFWVNEIEKCGADVQCREVKRINVSAAFFLSIEFKETGYLVYLTHKAAFGTGERLRLRTFLEDAQEIGRGLVVGEDGWQAQLEANKHAYFAEFVERPEFLTVYPATMPPAQFVDLLDANSGGALTQAERDSLVDALANGATRAAVLRRVAENGEFSRRELTRAFVLMQYFGYLRRAPAEPPDSDFSGWQFWLGKLDRFGGNFVQAEMVKAFLDSVEYRNRFGH